MTAQVLIHPTLREQLVAEAMAEVDSCEEDIKSLTDGTIAPQEYGPEFDYYGAKEDAIEAAHIALSLARERVDRLLEEHPDRRGRGA